MASGEWRKHQGVKDKWLQSPTQYEVQTPINTIPVDAVVSDLMLTSSNQWNK